MLSCERSHIFFKHENAYEINALLVQYISFTYEMQRLNALVKSHTYTLGIVQRQPRLSQPLEGATL
jgi:hypothetical protein